MLYSQYNYFLFTFDNLITIVFPFVSSTHECEKNFKKNIYFSLFVILFLQHYKKVKVFYDDITTEMYYFSHTNQLYSTYNI